MSTKVHPGSLVCTAGNLPFSRLHDDLLAIDEKAGYCYSLNPSAARIWELIANPAPVSSICAVLTREFGVAEEECSRDVIEFIRALADAGLVKVTD